MKNLEGFVAYFQPQYEHSTGRLVGAEALARRIDEDGNVIPPAEFINKMERDGSITALDYLIFEESCSFIRECIDAGIKPVTISINITRHDILAENFVDTLESIRKKYNVPVHYLWLEITESAVMIDIDYVNRIIAKLHDCGYVISMDDFGSGYSSLNILKDMDLDAIKLDMNFFRGDVSSKAGIILNSIMYMARWLQLAVIAEGVDDINQAEFMKSIGCDYIQGYIYSKPLPREEMRKLLTVNERSTMSSRLNLINLMDSEKFWDPQSLDTIIFNSMVGGTAIFTIDEAGTVEILRMNDSYIREIQMQQTIPKLMEDPMVVFDEENTGIFYDAVKRAAESGEEQEFTTWRTFSSDCCGSDRLCIRSKLRLIGKSNTNALFYATIMNVTQDRRLLDEAATYERGFKTVLEQADMYFWEYEFETGDMIPCYRCMRDMGLPPVVHGYPEPMAEWGIYPEEGLDTIRKMLNELQAGAEHVEEILPLTKERIPFIIRYDLECDNHGNPIKAYGSAAKVVE